MQSEQNRQPRKVDTNLTVLIPLCDVDSPTSSAVATVQDFMWVPGVLEGWEDQLIIKHDVENMVLIPQTSLLVLCYRHSCTSIKVTNQLHPLALNICHFRQSVAGTRARARSQSQYIPRRAQLCHLQSHCCMSKWLCLIYQDTNDIDGQR